MIYILVCVRENSMCIVGVKFKGRGCSKMAVMHGVGRLEKGN